MAWSGAGVFARLYNWVQDRDNSIKILASRMDAEFDNFKGGLENCLTRTGETPPTAALAMNAQKITGLANGAAATDACAYGQLTTFEATLGTMSTQAASAVAITGGTATLTNEREARVANGNFNASVAVDWDASGLWTGTATGASAALTFSNLPSGKVGYMTLDITNGGLSSAANLLPGVKWIGGSPQTFTASGRDIVTLMCHDGATVNVVGFLKGMA